MKIIKEVKSHLSNKSRYEYGMVHLPKEWIGKIVEIKEKEKRNKKWT